MTSDRKLLLQQEAKEVIKHGYMTQDQKNLITWGALTSLIMITSIFSYSAGYTAGGTDTHEMFEIAAEFSTHKYHPDILSKITPPQLF